MFFVQLTQLLKEVVLEDKGQLHQCVRVNPLTGEDEIDVVAVAAQLLCNPRHFNTFLCHYLPDVFADMYVRNFLHKKSVEPISCLNIRVSTPTNLTSCSTP